MDIIIHGCSGHMGKVVERIGQNDPEINVIAGIDINTDIKCDYPVFSSLKEMYENGTGQDAVIIDFSNAKALDALLDFCGETKTPVVLCTTGLSDEQLRKLEDTAGKTAIVKSANMSIGVNLIMKLLKEAAETLCNNGFDVEIVEKHHNRKLDAPSGTAIMLADAVNSGLENSYAYNFDRSKERKKREHDEIGIVSVRGGNIVGEHDVIFAGEDEVIEIRHTAFSREIFAKGAIAAAKFLPGKEPGIYNMGNVIQK